MSIKKPIFLFLFTLFLVLTITNTQAEWVRPLSTTSTNASRWDITGSDYLINDSGILDINETKLNATIDARAGNGSGGSGIFNGTDGVYIYNDSGTIYFNETRLNSTINNNLNNHIIIAGAVLSGTDGDFNRTYTITTQPFKIIVDGWHLHDTYDYNYNGTDIIFLNRMFDEHIISVYS